MSRSEINIVVLDAGTIALPSEAWDELRGLGRLTLHHNTPHDDDSVIRERCRGARIVLTNKVPLRASVINTSGSVKLISTLATGYNIIDTAAASDHNVFVCNVPAYSTPAVAQHTVALILELTNRVGLHTRAIQQGQWVKSEFFYFCERPIVELSNRTVGFIGFGEIAHAVARLLAVFGASILAFRRNPTTDPEDCGTFAWARDLDQIYEESDIVSLHCPLTKETEGMINSRALGKMKSSAFLINTARGPLVVEEDLAKALRCGAIAGAALDVVGREPMAATSPLLGDIPNLVMTPHNGWSSPESQRRLLARTADNIRGFIAGKPVNLVAGRG